MWVLLESESEAPPTSVGFTVAVHVVAVGPRVLSAVQAVQEAPRDLGDDGSVRDGLGHAVDGSLQQQEGGRVSFRGRERATSDSGGPAFLPGALKDSYSSTIRSLARSKFRI